MAIFNMLYGSGGGSSYMTYTELMALGYDGMIDELNLDASGYFDYLTGNLRMYNTYYLGNTDLSGAYDWNGLKILYNNGTWEKSGEVIIFVIKTDSSGNLKIPIAGYSNGGSQSSSYRWWVSYDGGNETQYSGTGSKSSITIASGLTADSEHTVVIRPNSESYGWARAFGFWQSGVQTLLTEVLYDGSYMGYSDSATSTGNYFRREQYRGCTGLTTAVQEVLPNTVTTIGIYFRDGQYNYCTSLTTAPQEVLPNSVTTIGSNFRGNQYNYCTSLTTAPQEVLPNSVTTIDASFRYGQYGYCSSLTTAPQEVLPSSIATIGSTFRSSQYNYCTSLTTAPQEVLPNSVTTIGNSFRTSQYDYCSSLTTAAQEVLPNSVTTIGSAFRRSQYGHCTSLTTSAQEALPNSVTAIGDAFRRTQYSNCTNLTKIEGWIDLSIGNTNYRYSQFNSCNKSKTIKVLSDIGYAGQSNTLNTTYVAQVQVPSAYLQNFKDATIYPRSSITDSKFVGY